MKVGELIHQLRINNDMTLEDVAKRIGVSRQTMSRYETGVITSIPYDNLVKIANLFNVHPAYLMGWKESNNLVVSDRQNYDPFSDLNNEAYGSGSEENVEWRKLHSAVDRATGVKKELIRKVLNMTDAQAEAWNAVIR